MRGSPRVAPNGGDPRPRRPRRHVSSSFIRSRRVPHFGGLSRPWEPPGSAVSAVASKRAGTSCYTRGIVPRPRARAIAPQPSVVAREVQRSWAIESRFFRPLDVLAFAPHMPPPAADPHPVRDAAPRTRRGLVMAERVAWLIG